MKSICLTCLLYTLKDKPVEDNSYVDILCVWLSKIIQSGGLTENDIIYAIIDSRTCEYLENNPHVLSLLIPELPCSFTIISVDPPTTILEGMMYRFINIDYTQDIYIYCDIDILISNSLHTLTEKLQDNTIYICSEGQLYNNNYSEGFSDTIEDKTLPGFSSGKFIILGKELRNSLFNTVNGVCNYSTDYMTKDQPFFNRAIYMIPQDKVSVDINVLTEHVSFNGHEYNKEKTIFNDMAGLVANGKYHATKIMNALALYNVGYF